MSYNNAMFKRYLKDPSFKAGFFERFDFTFWAAIVMIAGFILGVVYACCA